MRLFLKRSRGSITVLVTLILVPTIFFSGFLVDLARLKLYGNQAVMTADNYGETVLTMYDNLLKELYGLFAVTQDEEALKQLDALQEYVKSSFDPSGSAVSWHHLTEMQEIPGLSGLLGKNDYEGFMPYRSADVELSYSFPAEANLRNNEVFATQIGDFMRFRIAQQLIGDGADVLDALDEVQKTEGNAKAIDKRLELNDKARELFELAEAYYHLLKDFTKYPDYIRGIKDEYTNCKTGFGGIAGSESYQHYRAYENSDKNAMNAAVAKRDRIEEAEEEAANATPLPAGATPAPTSTPETLSGEEQKLVDIYDAYQRDADARRDKIEKRFDDDIKGVKDKTAVPPINFDNFGAKLQSLREKADKISQKSGELAALRGELQGILNGGEVSDDLKTGIEGDLQRMDELFSQIGLYGAIVHFIDTNDTSVNSACKAQTQAALERLEEIKNAYLNCGDLNTIPAFADGPDASQWKDFTDNAEYKGLYESLKECFESGGTETEGSKKKEAAENLSGEAAEMLHQEETTSARNIPDSFGYGVSGGGGGFDLTKMVGQAADLFTANGLKNEANRLLLKLYMVEYDFGMFSSRTTNIDTGADGGAAEDGSSGAETAVSLTGYEKAANLNYLYQAELEYILGGSNTSKKNLEEARNKILAFRAIVNFTATYSIDEINHLIDGISKAVPNPILGLVVNGALRLAVAGIETAMDWNELKGGKGVVLIKTDLKHLTAYDKIAGLLNRDEDTSGNISGAQGTASAVKLDYDQYLLVMLVFFTSADQISERTQNLIELNVNTALQGTDGELKPEFRLTDAHTAVNASCTVDLDFVVMPKGFAKSVVTEETYDGIEELEKKGYCFTVTRGY